MRIHFELNWRPDQRTLIHPGTYRVPEDIREDLAARALNSGKAVKIEEVTKKAPENKGTPPAFIRAGETKRSQSSEAGQVSASETSTGSTAESSQSTTHGDSAQQQTSSTPATRSGGKKRGRPRKNSKEQESASKQQE